MELTHDQHHITHQIAPDIDAERDLLAAHLKAANVVYTDGDIKISLLVDSCKSARRDDRRSPTDPPLLAIKSLAWDEIAQTILVARPPAPKNSCNAHVHSRALYEGDR